MTAYVGARCPCGGAVKIEVPRVIQSGETIPRDVAEKLHTAQEVGLTACDRCGHSLVGVVIQSWEEADAA